MKLTIENFLITKRASIQLADAGKITLIAGPTGSGKTTILNALRALSTGETMPLEDVTKKKDARILVHDGAKSAAAELSWWDEAPGGKLT